MEKRGLSHIEAIISFVIFIGFLIFAFIFFGPFQSNRVLDSSLSYAITEINQNVSSLLETYSLVINHQGDSQIGLSLETDLGGARVEDNNGQVLASGFDRQNVYFERAGNDFVVVLFNDDFKNGGLSSGEILSEENYSVSSSDEREVLSEKRLIALNKSYHESYVELKNQFNLPNRVDFAFQLRFDDGGLIDGSRTVPEDIEVFSSEERIETVRTDGSIVFADLIVSLW